MLPARHDDDDDDDDEIGLLSVQFYVLINFRWF